MKLIEIVEATAGGVGRHVIDLTGGLLSRGHEVHLLYSDLRADDLFIQDLHRLAADPGFQAHQISMRHQPSRHDVSALCALWQYFSKHGPYDLLHCHSTKAGLIGRLGLPANPVKRLYTPHGFFTMDPTRGAAARRFAATLESALARRCDGVVTVSREEYSHALNLGIPSSKLCRIPNGVAHDCPNEGTLERKAIRQQWGILEGEVCVGFVGRLVPVKSPATMLRAFSALLQRTSKPARLIMIGDGPLAEELRLLASRIGIQENIVWLGEQNARPLMKAFDVLALTSESEAQPLVVLEALARGLPVVATAVGGIADAVQHGINGFVAPVRGWHQIAESLGLLIGNPALRARMGEASRARSLNFSIDRMVDQTLSFYSQILAGTWQGTASPDISVPALH